MCITPKKRLRAVLDELQQRLAVFAHEGNGASRQDGDQQHLQQLPRDKGAEKGVRDDIERELAGAQGRCTGGVSVAHGKRGAGIGLKTLTSGCEAFAGVQHVDHHQAHGQGQRGHQLEVQQGLGADTTEFSDVTHRRDAVHHRAENDRRDHHFDEFDEAVAERTQGLARVGKEVPNQDAREHRHQHLNVQNFIPALGWRNRLHE